MASVKNLPRKKKKKTPSNFNLNTATGQSLKVEAEMARNRANADAVSIQRKKIPAETQEPVRQQVREPIELKRENNAGIVAGHSTNLGTSLVGGAAGQASRLISDTESEIKRIAAGVFTGLSIGLGAELLGAELIRGGTAVSRASTIGKLPSGGFGKITSTAESFATNSKTTGLTTSLFTKIGKWSAKNAGALIAIVGSYPFAGFIKEEALQTLGFATRTALENKDVEGATIALQEQAELLDPSSWDSLIAKIPFINVVNQLTKFYKAARIKMATDAKAVELLLNEQALGESQFQVEKRESDEASTQRKVEQQGLDSEYFRLIREGKFEEAEEFRLGRIS